MKVPVHGRGFHGLLWTQALGAFNDNAFKTLIALMAVATLPAAEASRLIALAGGLFILPFVVFSTFAGTLADRYSKRNLIILFKGVELVLMALTFVALATLNLPFLLCLLALMGTQSALFGPVKLGILPEILEDKDLSRGNGLIQMMTFAGILFGTVAAGLLMETMRDNISRAAGLFVCVSVVGLAASLLVPRTAPSGSRVPARWNFVSQAIDNLKDIHSRYGVFLALVGAAYFWFLGAIFQMNILVYGKDLMHVTEGTLSAFQVLVAVGIAVGSYLAGRLSGERVELGLVPAGAVGMVLFSLDLAFSFRSTGRTMADLFLLGASAGCFVVPLQTFIQQRSPVEERGKYIAMGNILSCGALLVSSFCLWAFTDLFRLHPGQIFLVSAIMTSVVAAYIIWTLPDFFLRLVFYPFAHLLYKIRVVGAENVPLSGPALLVANHVSHVDPVLVTASTQRLIRFLMYRPYYEAPLFHYFFRAMGCVPISKEDSPREMLRSFDGARKALEAGELVCIFAEGQITRHGQMLPFKRGFERIIKRMDVPVIPVHLDRVWGSVFSFEGGRFFYKKPRRMPYPVTVSFGKPMLKATAHGVRQAILELGANAFHYRLDERAQLPVSFMREAKRHPFRMAMIDSSGAKLSYAQAMVKARVVGGALAALDDRRSSGKANGRVGLLLPPSVGGALANLGLSMMGRVPANLNYTSSPELVEACAEKAGLRTIVTSRRFIDKIGWEKSERMVFLEEVAAGIPKLPAALTAAAMWLLPAFLVERLFLSRSRGPLDNLATILFTSGSTGVPKGVMLTHANIHSNIDALAQLYQVTADDRVLGVLPFFHSFGYTGTIWFPMVSGLGTVFHFTPLDAKRIGQLVEEHKATFLLGTPTFLLSYMRRIPAEKLRSLRYLVVGAEKLRADVARSAQEKFGLMPLEGYGCTELSPVAAVNIPDFEKDSGTRQRGMKLGTIGLPLPGVLMKVVDPDTGKDLPPGSSGLLLVKGPNVMKGYLDDPERTAECLRDGYYVTGDIAAIDDEGFITITDRLSRFSKIGGEMIPHVRVEDKLQELAGLVDRAFVVTAVEDPRKGEKLVVLYKDFNDVESLRRKLEESLPKLWVPAKDAFHRVEEFPLLGSGKLDMRGLKAVAAEKEGVDA